MTDHMKATETLYNPDTLLIRVRTGRERAAWDAYDKAIRATVAAEEAAKEAAKAAEHAYYTMMNAMDQWKRFRDELRDNHPGGRP